MSTNFTIASVIDKNKIASENVWLVLLDIKVKDSNSNLIEIIRVVQNNEDFTYKGEIYTALNFSFDYSKSNSEEPTFKLSLDDVTGVIRRKLDSYDGGTTSSVIITIINSSDTSGEPELQEEYDIKQTSATELNISVELGSENPLRLQFPVRKQYKNRCVWLYKGSRCGYSGGLTTCDYTLEGTNGCVAHNNEARFGGFPGLQNRY
jgi:hypothetical protein